MAAAGCNRISIGIESASPRILKVLRKETDLSKGGPMIGWLKQAGIQTYLDFMIGSPGETLKEIQQTINFAIQTNPDYVQFSLLIPYPQTDLYSQILSQDTDGYDPWQSYASSPTPDFDPPLANTNFSRNKLKWIVAKAYRKFYWRPTFILDQLTSIKSMRDFFYKSKAALRLFLHKSPWQ
jgi:magnesium-protoporphyrin IX monomethyl ester (oxidative) cyclase